MMTSYFRHNMNWDELNCRLVSSKELITISIQKMEQMDISYNSLTNDILDQLIGPNGDEPQILLSVGSNNLVNTDGYPPWVRESDYPSELSIFRLYDGLQCILFHNLILIII